MCVGAAWLLNTRMGSLPWGGTTQALQGGPAQSAGHRCSMVGVVMLLICYVVVQ